MLFNSFEFIIFLPVVFFIYWFVFKNVLKAQNLFLLLASYFFYAWWDWRFLALIVASSLIDYIAGIQIERSTDDTKRKSFLWLSICFNLGILFFFKYFNFFADSLAELLELIGLQANPYSLQIILPIGISFYTFQTLSYTIDVYRKKLKAEKDVIAFFAYVSFFPQLVAGPIERASNLLPQFHAKRLFSYERGSEGMRLIMWGLFKKIVVADNSAILVNDIFSNYNSASGIELVIGASLFAFQIYGDFSGYSDMAIGIAKLFGFDLMTNFRTPYFSRDIAEFWRRWHISLSTWFRDYLYVPLGGSRSGKVKTIRNTFLIFIVSGFWHGANWTFIMWGVLHALYFLPLLLIKMNRNNMDVVASERLFPTVKEVFSIIMTFSLVTIGWIFFRSQSLSDAFSYLGNIVSANFWHFNVAYYSYYLFIAAILAILIGCDWLGRIHSFPVTLGNLKYKFLRYTIYVALVIVIVFCGSIQETEFIYFQF